MFRRPGVRRPHPPDDASLVEQSFARLKPRVDRLSLRLYERLFADHPPLRDLFPQDLDRQRGKIVAMLAMVVRFLRHAPQVDGVLHDLGRQHVAYGVKPEHFVPFRDALLGTLAEIEGSAWTPGLRDAWARTLERLCQAMKCGLPEARQQWTMPRPRG